MDENSNKIEKIVTTKLIEKELVGQDKLHENRELIEKFLQAKMSHASIARFFNVSRQTFSNYLLKLQNKNENYDKKSA